MITLTELSDKLKREEECSLLEMLNISSEDIVDRFSDLIEERYDVLVEEYEETEDV